MGGTWPLAAGSDQRVWKNVSNQMISNNTTANFNFLLQTTGPITIGLNAYTDLWTSVASLEQNYHGPGAGMNHVVCIVGSVADPNIPSGGYYIIKNSWGTGGGDNGSGYYYTPWGIPEADGYGQNYAVTGAVYYTGTMYFSGSDYTNPANYHTGTAAIATWTGNGGTTWSTSAANNWKIGSSAFTWVNQEVGAIFDNTSSNRSITVSGTAIAHALTFNPITSGSTYTISGGSLTVTAGGIAANENVVIDSPISVGAPQSWTVAAGKTMTLGGVNMVIKVT